MWKKVWNLVAFIYRIEKEPVFDHKSHAIS